ncbi:hypothetical protein BHE74_00035365 [Ensete ventricosum]|nr:hypothetical protein BHE74_00035365 [Ensete ventricosum]
MSLRPRKRHQVVPAKPPDSLFMGESPPAVAKPTLVPIAESPIGAEVPQGSPPIYPVGLPMGGALISQLFRANTNLQAQERWPKEEKKAAEVESQSYLIPPVPSGDYGVVA